jgi:hypothetical protein
MISTGRLPRGSHIRQLIEERMSALRKALSLLRPRQEDSRGTGEDHRVRRLCPGISRHSARGLARRR